MTTKNDVLDLLNSAVKNGVLSTGTQSLLSGNLGQIVVAGAAGTDMENIDATDVTLVTLLVDASSSIHDAGLASAVREGHKQLLEAFEKSRERNAILVSTWLFSDELRILHSYVPIEDAIALNLSNYQPHGCTILHDAWCDALTANVAYAEKLRAFGTPCRSVAVVITDGADCGSKRSAQNCMKLSQELLKTEQFVLAFVGVGNEQHFRGIATSMGVPAGNVQVETEARSSNVRRIFHMVSQSAIKVSQGKVMPGQATGFFAP